MSSQKDNFYDYLPMLAMGVIIILVQLLSLVLAGPMADNNIYAFEDPGAVSNSLYYIAMILMFTLVVIIAIKKKMAWIIQILIYGAVLATLYYVFYALLTIIVGSSGSAMLIATLMATVFTVLLYKFPEWYIIDIVGVSISAGACAILGISLSILPTILLLVLLAIYDAISVYQTKHMVDMAEGVMDLKLPILFIVPKSLDYSFRKENFDQDGERGAFFMGLGDAVMPTLLVVSANVFIEHSGFIAYPAIGSMIGTLAGFFALSIIVMKGKPQAGLPFLNTGVILGFLAGILASGIPLSSIL